MGLPLGRPLREKGLGRLGTTWLPHITSEVWEENARARLQKKDEDEVLPCEGNEKKNMCLFVN